LCANLLIIFASSSVTFNSSALATASLPFKPKNGLSLFIIFFGKPFKSLTFLAPKSKPEAIVTPDLEFFAFGTYPINLFPSYSAISATSTFLKLLSTAKLFSNSSLSLALGISAFSGVKITSEIIDVTLLFSLDESLF